MRKRWAVPEGFDASYFNSVGFLYLRPYAWPQTEPAINGFHAWLRVKTSVSRSAHGGEGAVVACVKLWP